jgi:hypothetical protein
MVKNAKVFLFQNFAELITVPIYIYIYIYVCVCVCVCVCVRARARASRFFPSERRADFHHLLGSFDKVQSPPSIDQIFPC